MPTDSHAGGLGKHDYQGGRIMQLTDEQLVEALKENGHDDLAEALAEKLAGKGPEGQRPSPGPTMHDLVRGKRAT